MRVNYTLTVVCSVLLVTSSQSKTYHDLPGYGPMATADWSIICAMPSIGQTWALASIGAVVEMGVLCYIETTAYGV
jgi:hypothetical protein